MFDRGMHNSRPAVTCVVLACRFERGGQHPRQGVEAVILRKCIPRRIGTQAFPLGQNLSRSRFEKLTQLRMT